MAEPRVWISLTGRAVDLGPSGPGAHWQEVGTIDTTSERDLWNNVQVFLGLRQSAPALSGFYIDGNNGSPWVSRAQSSEDGTPFWLTIDPYGDGSRYLVTIEQASLGKLARRPAETHPGRLDSRVPVGIRVEKRGGEVFELHRGD